MKRSHLAAVAVVAVASAVAIGGIALEARSGGSAVADATTLSAVHGQNGDGFGRGGGEGLGQGGGGEGLGQGAGGEARELGTHVASDTSQPLTTEDAGGLIFMREEEKLARDVYVALGDMYDLSTFDAIAQSESRHMDSVKTLLDAYSLDDPTAGNGTGEFTDPALDALYEDLMNQADDSLAEALEVAIAIEEKDIADLEARIAATDRADLDAVYGNLLRGSENHLRAYTNQLERLAS
jgi:hypothetical protein